MPAAATLRKGARVVGDDRTKIAEKFTKQYTGTTRTAGKSIREIADESGRSYGFVHRVLNEAGVELRGRGGAVTKRK